MIYPNWTTKLNIKAVSICRNDTHSKIKNSEMPEQVVWLDQVHGNKICNLDVALQVENFSETYQLLKNNQQSEDYKQTLSKCDASFTTKSQLACAIRTADCLPILLTDTEGQCIAGIHAGWRGLLHGVIENTIQELKQATHQELIAWIGPAICQQHFTVGSEVRDQFLASNQSYHTAFEPSYEAGKWQADLVAVAEHKLASLGVNQVDNLGCCTYCDPEIFDSYRRDGADSGRIITLIWKL